MINVIVFILMFVFLMLLMKPELYPFVALIFFFLIGCFLFILWIREKGIRLNLLYKACFIRKLNEFELLSVALG